LPALPDPSLPHLPIARPPVPCGFGAQAKATSQMAKKGKGKKKK